MGLFEWNRFFTLTTLFTGMLFAALIIGFIFVVFHFEKVLSRGKIQLLFIGCMVALIRIFGPIEVFYTKSIYVKGAIIPITEWLREKVFLALRRYDLLLLNVAVIALVIGVVKVIQYLRFLNRIQKLTKITEPRITEIMERLEHEYEKKIPYCVFDMPGSVEPFMFGLRKAHLVITKKDRESENLEFIMRHEIEHFMHHDSWYKLLFEIACTVFWWNPFVYVLRKQLSDILEFHNDEKISENWNDEKKLDYVTCLVKIAKGSSHSQHKYGMGMSCSRSSLLKKRVETVLEEDTKGNRKKHLAGIYLFLIALLLLSYSIVIEPDFHNDVPGTFEIDENTYVLYDDSDGTYHIMNGDIDEGSSTQLPNFLKERIINEK